jgi:replication factor C subunit 3/5
MSLWVDKYRPNSLNKLTLHADITHKLQTLAASPELPHLLFFGPPGAGKKCRVMALLREIFGPGVEHIKLEHRRFKTPTNKDIEIATLGSNYHIECNPSDAGNNDRFVIQEVIKEIASHATLQAQSGGRGATRAFKVVVLTEVDRLSKQAQAGLRRTMEKYSSQCRLILVCNSPSKIIEPVRSRCLGIRVPAPAPEDIASLLMHVARKENVTLNPAGNPSANELVVKISTSCNRNIQRALLMLETCKVQASAPSNHPPAPPGSSATLSAALLAVPPIPLPDWELYIQRVAREMLQEQSPSKLLAIRDMLYELLTNCIPSDVILTTLCRELFKSLDDPLRHEVAHWAAYYEHRMKIGSKEIFHLEAFVAKFMSVYKRWLISVFG